MCLIDCFQLQSLILYGLVLIPSKRKLYTRAYNFSGNYVYANYKKTTPGNRIVCDKMAILLVTRSAKIGLLMVLSLTLMYCVPLYNILIKREFDTIIPIILPFVDPKSKIGFCANMTNQLTFCVYAVCIIVYASESSLPRVF